MVYRHTVAMTVNEDLEENEGHIPMKTSGLRTYSVNKQSESSWKIPGMTKRRSFHI